MDCVAVHMGFVVYLCVYVCVWCVSGVFMCVYSVFKRVDVFYGVLMCDDGMFMVCLVCGVYAVFRCADVLMCVVMVC